MYWELLKWYNTVLLQVPASTHYSMVFYFVTRELVPGSLLQRFVDGDDEFRNSRMKLIPSVPKVLVSDSFIYSTEHFFVHHVSSIYSLLTLLEYSIRCSSCMCTVTLIFIFGHPSLFLLHRLNRNRYKKYLVILLFVVNVFYH